MSTSLYEFGLTEMEDRVKDWYDGFTFGQKTDIYNPWSILCFLDAQRLSTRRRLVIPDQSPVRQLFYSKRY